MNCEEFLGQFREALDGKVSEQVIQENVNYYRAYINNQIAGGKSESEVLKLLGEPRLLAKTIEESQKFASDNREDGQGSYTGNYGGYQTSWSSDDEYARSNDKKHIKLQVWIIAFAVVAVIILMLMVAFHLFVSLAPVIITFMLGGFLYRIIRNWLND